MKYIPLHTVSFNDHVTALLVEALMCEAERLAKPSSTYEAANQVRAAIFPATPERIAQGVFMLIAPTATGATLRRPFLAANDRCPHVTLTTSTLPEAIEALRRWYVYAQGNPTETKAE